MITDFDRKALVRLAAALPRGDKARRAIGPAQGRGLFRECDVAFPCRKGPRPQSENWPDGIQPEVRTPPYT